MTPILYIIASTFVAITAAAVAYGRRSVALKAFAVVLAFFGIPLSWSLIEASLSNPKEVYSARLYASNSDAVVVSAVIIPNTAIYMLLRFSEGEQPRYFKFPWDPNIAKDLRRAIKEATENGQGEIMMKNMYRHGLQDGDRMFYPAPQPPNPPKEGEDVPEYLNSPRYQL